MDVEAIRTVGEDWRPAAGRVLTLGSGDPVKGLFYGARVQVTGALGLPSTAETPGAFDYRGYLARTGVFFQLQTGGGDDWHLEAPETASAVPVADQFVDWGRRSLALGLPEIDSAVELLWAMTLGWKPGLNHEVQEPFMRSGTIHVFAISGLHIALIAGILVEILRLFGVPRGIAAGIGVPLVWAYTGITGWQASAIRSAVMWSVIAAGWVLNRPSNLINSLAGAGAALLAWDPEQLFLPGFQLSFGVVLSLALLAPRLQALDPAQWLLDPLVPATHRSPARLRLWRIANWLWRSMTVSLAAWLGSAPLIAHYFHLWNPISLLANLVVVPLSSIALTSSLASLATATWCPWATELFNHGSWFWMQLMLKSSDWAAAFPGGCWNVREPGWIGFAVYYGLLLGVLNERVRRGRLAKGFWTVWLGLTVMGLAGRLRENSVDQLVLLSRRGGAALWVRRAEDGRGALIDPGDARVSESIIAPFLRSRGVNELDDLIISQGTVLASGGASWLEDHFPIHNRAMPAGNLRSPYLRHWQEDCRRGHRPLQTLSAGTSTAGWRVLHPRAANRSLASDEAPLVLMTTLGGIRVLWLSTLNPRGQDALMSGSNDLSAQLVIGGIPARGEPMVSPLLERIRPEVVVVADAEYPSSNRASTELRDRLGRQPWRTYFVSDCATLEIGITDGQIHVRPWRLTPPRQRASEDSPAGSDP